MIERSLAVVLTLEDDDALAREDDLDFLAELRKAELPRLCQLKTNLGFGGPPWMRMAVERAIARVCRAKPRNPRERQREKATSKGQAAAVGGRAARSRANLRR